MEWGFAFAGVPVMLTLLGVVWKMSGLASSLTEAVKAHKDDLDEIREGLASLREIPIILHDLRQMKELQAKFASEFPKLDKRLLRAEWKMGLTPSGFRPPSMHDIEVYESEKEKDKEKKK
jgi:hypothetical protein